MDSIMNFFLNGGPARGIAERKEQEDNGDVLHTTVEEYTVDSCWTFDAGYETALWKNDHDMVIVERYNDQDEMIKGHKKWCEFCKMEPKKVFSVQYDENVEL